MKKLISMVIAMMMVIPLIPVRAEYAPQFEYEAQMLYDLGLFKGTENGFDLDKKCDRLQAAALFIRLLGKEAEAMNNPKSHPFTDVPEWASPYVGQMYYDGYTKGISPDKYGAGDITANQFATFCLRALGYVEVDSMPEDPWKVFMYQEALEKMLGDYIIRQNSYDIINSSDVFLRDYAVKLAYNSLFDSGMGMDQRFLIKKLIDNGVIDEEIVKSRDLFIDDGIRYLYSAESFLPYCEGMIREAASENKTVSIISKSERGTDLTNSDPKSFLIQELLYETQPCDGVLHKKVNEDDLATSNPISLYTKTTVPPDSIEYRCIRYISHGDVELNDIEKQLVAKAKEFLATITDDMSDYDKYKAANDYVTDNIEYNLGAKVGRADSLVYGESTCSGYAKSYMLLCRLMGLECWLIGGDVDGQGHLWNKVKLDGKYYNVDATWNDGRSGYEYFLFRDMPNRIIDEDTQIWNFPATEDYHN